MRATGDRDRRPSPFPRPDEPRRVPNLKTSKRRRYIGAASALVVAGAVTMGFLGGGTAMADGGADEVVFNGKCGAVGLGLGNESAPDKSSMTVTSGDEVTFTNNLGTKATLHIGTGKSTVEKGDSKTVQLSNSTEAQMSPKCPVMLDDHSEKTTINVEPREDSDGGSDGGNSGGDSGSGDDSDGGSSDGDSGNSGGDSADKPGDSPNAGKKPKAEGNNGDPNKGDDKDKSSKKKDDEDATLPGDSSTSEGGGGDSSDSANVDANKVSNENSASGLLAALAALCLAGVGFAAIRTFIGNRAAANA